MATTTHRVRPGDTLSGLARQYGTTVEALMQANGIRERSRIYVGRTLVIPGSATAPATGSPPAPPPAPPRPAASARPPPPSSEELGSLSRHYEARNPGVIAHNPGDAGGASYGAYQFATKVGAVQAFIRGLEKTHPDYFAAFSGKVPGTPAFDAVWKELYQREPERFFRAQHEGIERSHYQPALKSIARKVPALDTRNRSRTLLDCIWSTAVQHGPGGAGVIFELALAGKDVGALKDEDVLAAVYGERGRKDADGQLHHFRKNSLDVQKSVAGRFVRELAEALQMLKRERERANTRPPPVAPLTPAPSATPAPSTPVTTPTPAPVQATPKPPPSAKPPPPSVDPRKDPLNASYTPADPNPGEVVPGPKPQLSVKVPFLSQFTPGQGFKEGGTACFLAAQEMARRAGAIVSGPERRIQLLVAEDDAGNVQVDAREAAAGREYIEQQLRAGRPVIVGVTHQWEKKYNSDKMTDHFVVVTGRDVDAQGRVSYAFHDPATSVASRGSDTNPKNRFLVDPKTGGLYRDGKRATGYVTDRQFHVSMVRRNQ
jgi:murein DD-endopeptidase MepM/ murein hydrolase activator NlpD